MSCVEVEVEVKVEEEQEEVLHFFFFFFFLCKCTFSSYILTFFHFNAYVLFLSFLVPKPINTGHLNP